MGQGLTIFVMPEFNPWHSAQAYIVRIWVRGEGKGWRKGRVTEAALDSAGVDV